MKINQAQTKTESIGKDAKSVGRMDSKEEVANVKADGKKKEAEYKPSVFSHMSMGVENIYDRIMNTRRGKHGRNMPAKKHHVNKAKFSKKAKLKRRK